MAWKNQERKKQYDREYQNNYSKVTLAIRKDSDIPEALAKMKAQTGMQFGRYALIALIEKLKRDKFLPKRWTLTDGKSGKKPSDDDEKFWKQMDAESEWKEGEPLDDITEWMRKDDTDE